MKAASPMAEMTILTRWKVARQVLSLLSPAEQALYLYLISIANDKRGDDRHAVATVAEDLGWSERHVRRITAQLVDKNLVRRELAGRNGATTLLMPQMATTPDTGGKHRTPRVRTRSRTPDTGGQTPDTGGTTPDTGGRTPDTQRRVTSLRTSHRTNQRTERESSSPDSDRSNQSFSSTRSQRSRLQKTNLSSLRSQNPTPQPPAPNGKPVGFVFDGKTEEEWRKIYGDLAELHVPGLLEYQMSLHA